MAGTSRQLLPFQRPDRPLPAVDPVGPVLPTATQLAVSGHETPSNWLDLPLAGAGTGTTAHLLPFQVAAAALPELSAPALMFTSVAPTATHEDFARGHDTRTRTELAVPFG